jgi:hypothetical protein
VLTLSESFDDQNEVDKGEEDDVKLFKSGEDAAEALQSSEKPFHCSRSGNPILSLAFDLC